MKPGCDPLGVGAGEQLFGRLAELQNLRQHGDSLVRILGAAQRKRRRRGSADGGVTLNASRRRFRERLFSIPVVVNAAFVGQRVKHWRKKKKKRDTL